MMTAKHSDSRFPLFSRGNKSLTQRVKERTLPRKFTGKPMYIEDSLLRESRNLSKAKNKYTTNMLENASLAENLVSNIKSVESYRTKEHKLGILTPITTTRFETTGISNLNSFDPNIKTLSAAGLSTSSDVQLIYKELGNHRKLSKTEMGRPNLKILYTRDSNNKTFKAIQNIAKNLNKLTVSRTISSQRDLNKKLLSAPSNFNKNYDKGENIKFNEALTLSQFKPDNGFNGVEAGSPERKDQRLTRLRKDYGFIDRNGNEFKTFADMHKSMNLKTISSDNSKFLDFLTAKLMNQDQRINYSLLKEGKHKATDTLGQKSKKPSQKQMFKNPFKTVYSTSSESKIIWSDKQVFNELNFNNPSINYDPLNPFRFLGQHKDLDFNNPKTFVKVNGISEFTQITHPFNSNHNKDYLQIVEKNKHFRKTKGMCAEFLKLAKYQPK